MDVPGTWSIITGCCNMTLKFTLYWTLTPHTSEIINLIQFVFKINYKLWKSYYSNTDDIVTLQFFHNLKWIQPLAHLFRNCLKMWPIKYTVLMLNTVIIMHEISLSPLAVYLMVKHINSKVRWNFVMKTKYNQKHAEMNATIYGITFTKIKGSPAFAGLNLWENF